MKKENYEKLKTIAIVLFIVALGLGIWVKWVEWKYQAQFLSGPCELCSSLNKNQSKCIEGCFIQKTFYNTTNPYENLTLNLEALK